MDSKLVERLVSLADKYEVASFCEQDPSRFLRWYKEEASCKQNTELAAFIAAMLSFGNRKQFIPKIEYILKTADSNCGNVYNWLSSGSYKNTFPLGAQKFYRFYSYDDMQFFFEELALIINKSSSLGSYFFEQWNSLKKNQQNEISLSQLISEAFPHSRIVPKGKNSANKRIHMFLRWMVRQNSSVDLGIWNWYSPARLIIPLDVHVLEEAQKLNLINQNAKPTGKTARYLTQLMEQVFPDDPCRADYALFGLGVDETNLI